MPQEEAWTPSRTGAETGIRVEAESVNQFQTTSYDRSEGRYNHDDGHGQNDPFANESRGRKKIIALGAALVALLLVALLHGKGDMSNGGEYTVEYLARVTRTTKMTIYRFIHLARSVGFAIRKVRNGVYQIVSMENQSADLTNLVVFTSEETSVLDRVLNGLDATNAFKGTLKRQLSALLTTALCSSKSLFRDESRNKDLKDDWCSLRNELQLSITDEICVKSIN